MHLLIGSGTFPRRGCPLITDSTLERKEGDQLCFVSTVEQKILLQQISVGRVVSGNRESQAYRESHVTTVNRTILKMPVSVETVARG